MNVIGYLVTLANIQNFAGSGGQLKDVSVRVSELGVLDEELKREPYFNPEYFRSTGFYRVGNVGKYLSRNLREYLYNGDADPKDEGLILTLVFDDKREFQDERGTDGAYTMFLPRGQVTEEDKEAADKYVQQEALDFGNRQQRVRPLSEQER